MSAVPTMDAALARLQESCVVRGRQAVTSAVPQAAAAGISTFALGGNAFDAALAACFVETIALPMKCGLAGDVVALFRVAGGPVRALLSIGTGAASLAQGHKLEKLGANSVGVPGAPDGYATLHGLGRLPLSTLIGPAVTAACNGVRWTRTSLSYLPEARDLLTRWSPGCVYLSQPQPEVDDVLRLPGLAALLEDFASSGPELFFGGAGAQLVSELAERGGFLTEQDLQIRPARICAATEVALKEGRQLFAIPAPTHGQLLVDAIARLENGAEQQATVVAELRAAARERGRDGRDGGTSVVTAADQEGNVVVIVHSNSFPRFGSGVVLSNGLVLNNRPGRGFDLQARPGSANAPAAGKTPPTTLHAWALLDKSGMTFGATPGGVNQLPWNVQSVSNLLDGKTLAQTVTAPRWGVDDKGDYSAEPGASLDDAKFKPRAVSPLSLRSVQQLVRVATDGSIEAAADPRTGARACASY
ncbi:MAG: Gamma-glutamyltransferase [Herminiimonas sp.]|nr:Gamma-glutamyltransferase [Herminiimonas sp.]MDB5854283.1 Gamma-glutamyltransferase [Herminiimonas sp.]